MSGNTFSHIILLAIANAVTNVSKRTSLYELPKEDLQKWEEENIKMQTSLEKKLEEVQQRSEHLEEEWGKGEKEWREYLVKLEKIEKDWEDIVRRQRTERAFLTLGISWLLQSDIKSLHRYSLLEDKVQRHMARSEELRRFYKDTREHQHGLQNTKKELSEWEKKLREHALELQKCIDQMEELGEKFSGEVKDCRERLKKSQEQLLTCKKKIDECKVELTKSQRRLQNCRDKLIECEVSLMECRDELGNNHKDITNCITSLQKKSTDLSW